MGQFIRLCTRKVHRLWVDLHFFFCRSSFEPSCSLHEIQYAPNFTHGRLGGSSARLLVVFLCEFGAS